MSSASRIASCAALAVLTLAGCSHMMENRAIDAFSTALSKGDLDRLHEATSSNFSTMALRSTESLDDLEILKLPTGDTSIVEVEDGDQPNERKVTVQIGDSKKKRLLYTLVEDESGRWVVDDIFVRQRRRGHTATRSVTEQMDLLLSVREFLDAWTDGDRDDVLDVTAPELGRVLSELPPSYLARVTRSVTGGRDDSKSARKPDAQLDGDRAIVTLPRTTGKLVLSMAQDDGKWQVADVALEARREDEAVPSILKQSTALATAVRFLDAYASADQTALANLATPSFHKRALKIADLRSIPLPQPSVSADDFELTLEAHRADFVLPGPKEVVKLSLVRQNDEDVRGLPPVYRVEETTLYDVDEAQEKRLSALFTAHASLLVFAKALRERDLPIVRKTSSPEFNRIVWNRLRPVGIEDLPLPGVAEEPPRIVSTVFRGAVTEVNVVQGPRAMTYVLLGRDADLLVDDILVPAEDRPASLRDTLELLTPVHLLAHGVRESEIPLVQRSSSDDFNRLVWSQARSVPPSATAAAGHVDAEVSRAARAGEKALLVLGDGNRGTEVSLVRERGYFVVDEMVVVNGPQPSDRWALKDVLRTEITKFVGTDDAPRRFSALNGNRPSPTERERSRTMSVDPLGEPISLDTLPPSTATRIEGTSFGDPVPGRRPAVVPAAPRRDGYDASLQIDDELGDIRIE